MKNLRAICIVSLVLAGCETLEEYQARVAGFSNEDLISLCSHNSIIGGPPSRTVLSEMKNRLLISADDASAIGAESVFVGMDDWKAQCSLGEPSKINRTRNAYGTREQWVYTCEETLSTGSTYDVPCKYVTVSNGKVTSISDYGN